MSVTHPIFVLYNIPCLQKLVLMTLKRTTPHCLYFNGALQLAVMLCSASHSKHIRIISIIIISGLQEGLLIFGSV